MLWIIEIWYRDTLKIEEKISIESFGFRHTYTFMFAVYIHLKNGTIHTGRESIIILCGIMGDILSLYKHLYLTGSARWYVQNPLA